MFVYKDNILHLDFVSNLTTQAFIASLKCFFDWKKEMFKNHIQQCINIYMGGSVEKLQNIVSSPDEKLCNFLTPESIEWEFIFTKYPNFVSIWKVGVKTF